MKPTISKIMLMVSLCLFMLGSGTVCSQNSKSGISHSKVLAILQRANFEYENERFAIAARDYEEYLSADTSHPNDVLIKLADCYWQIRATDNAFRVYKLLFQYGNEGATEEQKLRIGELYARYGMYKQAADWLQDVDGYKAKVAVYKRKPKLELLKRDSLSWNVGFLTMNSNYRDFAPVLVDSTLFFSSNRPLDVKTRVNAWDASCYTRLRKIPLNKIKTLPVNDLKVKQMLEAEKKEIITTKLLARLYEGADVNNVQTKLYFMNDKQYVQDDNTTSSPVGGLGKMKFNITGMSYDRNSHVYFSTNYSNNKDKINRICLMEGIYSANKIIKSHILPFGDAKSYSVMLPAVSPDGKILVFCSDKLGGRGKVDLYYALRDANTQKWGEMKTFDGDLNTVGNEVYPSIGADGYLYFSSNARPGLGGLDIYRILLQDAIDGKGEPIHLSYPINSSADDFGWTAGANGVSGFFTSDRLNHGDNLYSFDYKSYNKIRVISGVVLDELTKEPIENATIFVLNNNTGEVSVVRTDKTGKYQFAVNSANSVVIKVMKKGSSDDFLLDEGFNGTQLEDSVMKKVPELLIVKHSGDENDLAEEKTEGTTLSDDASEQLNYSTFASIQNKIFAKQKNKTDNSWTLNDTYYDYNTADLKAESKPMLDSLILMLKKFPLQVEISLHSIGKSGHTDLLSQRRAESVVAYLVAHGIARNRFVIKKSGEQQQLSSGAEAVPSSETERQLNRSGSARSFALKVMKKGMPDDFLMGEESEQLNDSTLKSIQNRIFAKQRNKIDNSLVLNNLYYDYNTADLKAESKPMLDSLILMLKKSSLQVEISLQRIGKPGHTDLLSQRRAESVVAYLVAHGIARNRFVIKESGEQQQLNSSAEAVLSSETERQLNRSGSANSFVLKVMKKVMSDDFLTDEESEQLNDSTLKSIQNRMFAKQNFKINNSWKLNDIYYDYNKADLRAESKPMLDSLILMLKKLPLRVEISSHTDSRGKLAYNDLLSQRRAESVVSYLLNAGIARDRLVAKGFGERQLLNRCAKGVPCSEAEHQLNRRTEVKVMGYSHKKKKYNFDPSKYKPGDIIDKATLPKDFFDN